MSSQRLPRLRMAQATLCGILFMGVMTQAGADAADTDVPDQTRAQALDPVVVTVTAKALHDSVPSQGSLIATQPQSIVGGDFIRNNDAPAANYTDIIKFTPSVWTVDPNGPGLAENLGTSIRGFQDGQFNVTFDGIPWGDSNDFTHHSTSYFMAQDIGNVVVDRGPGNAGTVGDATFGGTVYVQSADPKKVQGVTTLLSYGSFDTFLVGVRYDTGEISDWGGTRAFISLKSLSSDGYLTNANLERSNAFLKIVQPVNDSTDITLVSNLNKVKQNPPVGQTPNQLSQFGVNYGYNTDPASQGYFGYNLDRITTDYEYIGVNSKLGGWTFDNKLYTYAYYHDGFNGLDVGGSLPNGGVDVGDTPNGTVNPNGTPNPNNVPGQILTNNYRSVGDIFRVSHDLGPGEVQAGGWLDHQSNLRELVEADFSNNQAFNYDFPPGPTPESPYTDRLQHNQLFSRQAYLQYLWHVIPNLDVTGGLKYVNFERVIVSPVNQGTELPLDYSQTWTRDLPSLDAHYKLADNWSAYAQYAKGFLAPNLNILYVVDPSKNTVNPQGTTNTQVGTTWVGHALTVSADVYTINFSNEIASHTINNLKQFYNLGAVKYKGAEAEATYIVGGGFSVYANASYNSARLVSDQTWVPLTPDKTAALGVLYNQGPLQGSIMEKYVGPRYGDAENYYRLGGYASADAAIDYTFGPLGRAVKQTKLEVTVQNLMNRRSIYDLAGYSSSSSTAFGANGVPLLFTLPGRSAQVTLTASF
jgi:iron complex outermembrane receptor protein